MEVIIKHIFEKGDGSASALVHIQGDDVPRGRMVEKIYLPPARCREIAEEAAGDEGEEGRLLAEEVLSRADDVYTHALSKGGVAGRKIAGAELARKLGGRCHFKDVGARAPAAMSEGARPRPDDLMREAMAKAGMHRAAPVMAGKQDLRRGDGEGKKDLRADLQLHPVRRPDREELQAGLEGGHEADPEVEVRELPRPA